MHERPSPRLLVRTIVLTTAVALLALSTATTAVAGKPGSTSTLVGPVLVHDLDGDRVVDRGDSITFTVKTTATKTPNVGVRCYQGGTWVYDAYVGFYPGYMFDPWLTLDSAYWADGQGATCQARLFYNDKRGRQQVLATLAFEVAP